MFLESDNMSVGIIGAGASGCICAYHLLKAGISVTLYDKNLPLRTILPTGGGRCNLSYYDTDNFSFARNFPRGEKFLLSVLSSFSMSETVDYFESIGIKTYVQNDNRIFPVCDSSKIVSEILLNRAKLLGIELKRGRVKNITPAEEGFIVTVDDKTEFYKKIIITTGGKSFDLVKSLVHNIISPKPALCPLKILESDFNNLSGMSLKNVDSVVEFQNKKIAKLKGDLL